MALVVCPLCQARINVKDELLGRKAKCPKCANLITLTAGEVPAPTAAVSPNPPQPKPKPRPPVAPPPVAPPPVPPALETDFSAVQATPPVARRRAAPVVEELDQLEEVEDT